MNGKKAYLVSAITAVTALLIINIAVFSLVEKFTLNIWINYIFVMVAVILNIVLTLLELPHKPYFYGYACSIVGAVYMFVAIVAGLLFIFRFYHMPLFSLIFHIVILAAAVSAYLYAKNVNEEVRQHDSIRATELVNFKNALYGMESIVNRTEYTASYRKTVQHACDRLASAQIKSNPQVSELEKAVLDKIDELSSAVEDKKESDIITLCADIERLTDERERKLRIVQ